MDGINQATNKIAFLWIDKQTVITKSYKNVLHNFDLLEMIKIILTYRVNVVIKFLSL